MPEESVDLGEFWWIEEDNISVFSVARRAISVRRTPFVGWVASE
jgi:hypothetical protein